MSVSMRSTLLLKGFIKHGHTVSKHLCDIRTSPLLFSSCCCHIRQTLFSVSCTLVGPGKIHGLCHKLVHTQIGTNVNQTKIHKGERRGGQSTKVSLKGQLLVKEELNNIKTELAEKQKIAKVPPVVRDSGNLKPQLSPDPSVLVKRPPVVTIMGHVDHGKTTLLDALRSSNVVASESGGITQHIGAFSVSLQSGDQMTFLDTPGHAAFSAMRARGANITDIIVLVIAAEDGIMQQTIESINHAKSAKVPIIVAINKIDKKTADVESTKRMLLEHDVVVEEMGGDVQAIPISALKQINLTELQEAIITQAEVMDLKGDPKGMVEGRVVEAKTHIGRGRLVTAVIERGTLKVGDILVSGTTYTKVRRLYNDKAKTISQAGLSAPVEIAGWQELPVAGDEIIQVKTEKIARSVIESRLDQERKRQEEEQARLASISQLIDREKYLKRREAEGWRRRTSVFKRKTKSKEAVIGKKGLCLPVILKADVDGSLEAILNVLETFESDQIRLEIIHFGVGQITDKDIELAETFDGKVFGFNVQVSPSVPEVQKDQIRIHTVIYRLFDDIKECIIERLPIVEKETENGSAIVLQVFEIMLGKRTLHVAGCRCVDGSILKNSSVRVRRGGVTVFEGNLSSLKHHKKEVQQIGTDVECGLAVSDPEFKFQPDDEITCYDSHPAKADFDWDPGF